MPVAVNGEKTENFRQLFFRFIQRKFLLSFRDEAHETFMLPRGYGQENADLPYASDGLTIDVWGGLTR